MDRLVLASVSLDVSLEKALGSIRAGTRAIVVIRPEGPLLLTAGDIMAACNAALDSGHDPEKVKVGEVVPAHAPVKAAPDPLPQGVDMASQVLTNAEREHFERAFDQDDQRYLIQYVAADMAVVVTASENFKRDLSSSFTICTCAGDPKHSFEQRQLVTPGICNKPHGAKVTCRTVDGTA